MISNRENHLSARKNQWDGASHDLVERKLCRTIVISIDACGIVFNSVDRINFSDSKNVKILRLIILFIEERNTLNNWCVK